MVDPTILGSVVPMLGFLDNPGSLGVMIPIIALCIPIVAIIAKAQIQALELKHRHDAAMLTKNDTGNPEISELRNEVKELKELVHEQMIAVDNLVSNQTRLLEGKKSSEELQNRIGSE